MVERAQIESLLEKMGVAVPEKMSLERMTQKLIHHVTKKGCPAELTEAEEAVIIELGLSTSEQPEDAQPEEEEEPVEETEEDKAPAKKTAGKKDKKAAVTKDKKKKGAAGVRSIGLLDAFRGAFAKRKSIPRGELIASLEEQFGEGHKGSINNYIHKSTHGGKTGIVLEQTKDKAGKNILTKKG